jgi:hypothetical protein
MYKCCVEMKQTRTRRRMFSLTRTLKMTCTAFTGFRSCRARISHTQQVKRMCFVNAFIRKSETHTHMFYVFDSRIIKKTKQCIQDLKKLSAPVSLYVHTFQKTIHHTFFRPHYNFTSFFISQIKTNTNKYNCLALKATKQTSDNAILQTSSSIINKTFFSFTQFV